LGRAGSRGSWDSFAGSWVAPRKLTLVSPPPILTGLGQQIDRIVVLVKASQCLGIVQLDSRLVILGPAGNAQLTVVRRDLMHPPLSDEGHVADDPRCGKPGQVTHDVVLELLRLEDAGPP